MAGRAGRERTVSIVREQTFEFKPGGSQSDALDKALGLALAAGKLGIPFTLSHVRYDAFRHGGNVNKARCEAYRLALHESPVDARDV